MEVLKINIKIFKTKGVHMKKRIKNLIKEIKELKNKNNFTGSSYKSKGSIQSSTSRFNRLRK
jgi:hypothetical protein